MTAVLCGNLRAEIVGNAGVRLQRIDVRQAATDLLLPRQPEVSWKPPMLGRIHEAADAFAVMRAGRPVGFHSACGYGKTTLLRNIVAGAAERGLAPNCLYLRASSATTGSVYRYARRKPIVRCCSGTWS
jgi:hypothetical protein